MGELLSIGIVPVVLTLLAFQVGQLCQGKFKSPLCNPTLIAVILVAVVLTLTGMDTGTYDAGTKSISWLMTPATISLAIPMYEQFQLLRRNLKAILAGVAAGAAACIVMMLGLGLLFGFNEALIVSLMPKSVTTAIGVSLSELFGGMSAVTTAAIIVTGIFANMMGTTFCRLFRITDPVAQGVAFGTAGHVIGTAKANELSPLTGAVSSLSLVAAGLLTAVLFPVLTGVL